MRVRNAPLSDITQKRVALDMRHLKKYFKKLHYSGFNLMQQCSKSIYVFVLFLIHDKYNLNDVLMYYTLKKSFEVYIRTFQCQKVTRFLYRFKLMKHNLGISKVNLISMSAVMLYLSGNLEQSKCDFDFPK
jgi:hypothetical protein